MKNHYRHCKVTGKAIYTEWDQAERDADLMALYNWENGWDTWMGVYLCEHCHGIHIGTKEKRKREKWLSPMHPYRFIDPPLSKEAEEILEKYENEKKWTKIWKQNQ